MAAPIKDDMARRLDAFVDAAFAFAVTLLIVGGGDPPQSMDEMSGMLLRAPAYAGAFALIVMFWLGYRDLGRLWPHRDALATGLSLAIVFVVLVYVFPLRFIMEAAFAALSGGVLPGSPLAQDADDLRFLYVAYGAGCLALSTLYALLYRHHLRRGQPAPDLALTGRIWISNWSILAIMSASSVILALAAPGTVARWAPGFIYMGIPVLIGVSLALRAREFSALSVTTDPVDTGDPTS